MTRTWTVQVKFPYTPAGDA